MTELQTKVYNTSIEICMSEYCTDIQELSEVTKLPINTVKGVVGSLCAVNLMLSEVESSGFTQDRVLFPLTKKGEIVSFGYENEIEL